MTQVKMTKPDGLPRAASFIRQSNGMAQMAKPMEEEQRQRGRAQGGGAAQTWSDVSCITLTLAHWEPALHQLFNHFVRLLAIWPSTLQRPVQFLDLLCLFAWLCVERSLGGVAYGWVGFPN